MKISEAEEYVCEHTEDYIGSEFVLEDTDEYTIYLEQPAYVIPEYNLTCYEGYWYDKEQEQADFCLTAVFRDGEYEYWEQDGVGVILHNYLRITGYNAIVDILDVNIEVQNLNFKVIDMTYLRHLINIYKLKSKELV